MTVLMKTGFIGKAAFFVLVFAGLLLLCGCSDVAHVSQVEDEASFPFETFRDVPGVTDEEIAAIDALRESRGEFVFGQMPSTGVFFDGDGEMRGFSVSLCEFLTQIFGIPFVPQIFEWADLVAGLNSGTIDFTNDLTPNDERRKIYLMTDPIALRIVKSFRLKESLPIRMIAPYRPLRFAFLDGTTTENNVLKSMSDSVEVWHVGGYEEAYELLRGGIVDAFVEENSAERVFDKYDDVVSEDFIPITFSETSLATKNPELAPIINVTQKILHNGGIAFFGQLRSQTDLLYKRHKLQTWLTDAEREYIRENPVIKLLAEYDNYPVSFYNTREKEWQGIGMDVLNEATALLGMSYRIVNNHGTAWSEILTMLETGVGQMVTELIRTQEREGRFLWSEFEHNIDRYALLSRSDLRNIDYDEILYMRVGVVRGIAYHEVFDLWFPNHQNLFVYERTLAAFDALERGEIDLVMSSQNQLLYLTHFLEHPGFKINILFNVPFKSAFGYNASYSTLASIVDKALAVTDIEAIANYWTRKTYDYRTKIVEDRYPYLVGMVALCVLVIVMLVMMIVLRERSKKRKLKLQTEREIAIRTSQNKSRFLATMSHEIRTPMNAIIGISQVQLQKGTLPDEYAAAFNKIYNSGSALLGLINEILDMSKIETGKMELNPVEYDVPSLISDTMQLNMVRAGQKQISFVVSANENLPLQLCGDELKLKQILNNLLSNAIKYTQKGEVKLSASHAARGDDVMLRFTVEDTGQGMKAEDQEKLFAEYSRFNSDTNRNVEGTGIGLSITKKLAELMDGTIEFESEYGKGSKFTVTVKQKAVECGVIGAELSEKLRTFTFADRKRFDRRQINRFHIPNGRVLVVDDVETNLYVAEGMLAPYGLRIETAVSGYAAIEKVTSGFMYDMIFMDHMMPLMDGIETTKRVRALGEENDELSHLKTVPIIALTANALHGVKEMFLQNGFNDFLSKPIDTVELDMVLRIWMPKEKQLSVNANAESVVDDHEDIDIFIDGIDVGLGIQRSGGTKEKYLKMLSVFMSECRQRLDNIKNALNDNDMQSYVTHIHGFKSALANIGAIELSQLAAKLENAGRQNDKLFIDDNTRKLFDDFEPILRGVEKAVSSAKQKSSGDNNNSVDKSALASALKDLLAAIDSVDVNAINNATKLLAPFENAEGIGGQVSELLLNVLNGNYDRAETLAREIIKTYY